MDSVELPLRVTNLTGRTIGFVEVLRYAGTVEARAHWECRCRCGEVFTAQSKSLINASGSFSCVTCRPRRVHRAPVRTCTLCHESGHNRQTCQDREPKAGRCRQCAGLAHRRPETGCACGEAYAPERRSA